MTNFRVFIGWDSKEPLAFAVAAHSILRRASRPVAIVPLALSSLQTIYTRERGPTESTEFSLTRFLVPYFSGYEGISLFVDCDVLVQADVYDLLAFPEAEPDKAIFVCEHDYVPKSFNVSTPEHGMTNELIQVGQETYHAYAHSECGECRTAAARGHFVTPVTKFDGHEQTAYPRKNWSSVMLFRNDQCRTLTPAYVNTATGLQLHRFQWLQNAQIGSLPLEWNWLVGEYQPNSLAKILHYTNGTPCFPAYRDCDQADLWWQEYSNMLSPHDDPQARQYRYEPIVISDVSEIAKLRLA